MASVSTTSNEIDRNERESIRWALIDYMKGHKIGVPTLAARIKASHPREMEIPWKTLQRFLAGRRTKDIALTICKNFVATLPPNRPTAFQALGQALRIIYNHPLPPDIAGTYDLATEDFSTTLSITNTSDGYALVTERCPEKHYIHDGVIVATATAARLVTLRDRLLLTPRYLMVSGESAYVYEYSPLKNHDIMRKARFTRHAEADPVSARQA